MRPHHGARLDLRDVGPAVAEPAAEVDPGVVDPDARGPAARRSEEAANNLQDGVAEREDEEDAEAARQQHEGGGDRRHDQGEAGADDRELAVGARLRLGLQHLGRRHAAENSARMADDQSFRESLALSRLVDPMPTLEALARNTGTEVDDIVHHALVRYASDGAAALLALEPHALRELIAARRAEDWEKVRALIDWLAAGLDSAAWR